MTKPRHLVLIASTVMLGNLSACGLSPLYADGPRGAVSQTLSSVSIAPIEGEAGWLVRGALRDRLRTAGESGNARYRVDVRLDDRIDGFGVRIDDSVTRERRTLRARWQLVDTVSGATVIDDTAGSDSGIDVVGSEYATIAAERTALERLSEAVADQIVTRIAVRA
jgi:LPS-assembly lipoprotein